jgi:hypothetical protein
MVLFKYTQQQQQQQKEMKNYDHELKNFVFSFQE